MSKVLILGGDGYLGWSLILKLLSNGYDVSTVDNLSRRMRVRECLSDSATPILPFHKRMSELTKIYEKKVPYGLFNIAKEPELLDDFIDKVHPDVIVDLAQIPSAPYSMRGREECNITQMNNIVGTNNVLWSMRKYVPECHLIHLGTMGEYGTSNLDIPEGFFEVEFRGRKDYMSFPRKAGSFYHLGKVHESYNVDFACRVWGLTATDVMQGVVYGAKTDEMIDDSLLTRFDFDESFGTALNRFCAQAVIGEELTPYGVGGQKRGYLSINDSMQCLKLLIDNPPKDGEYRVVNQLDECYTVNELAELVVDASSEYGLNTKVKKIDNPRVEAEEHYYNPDHNKLPALGFKPTRPIVEELHIMIPLLMRFKDRIVKHRRAMTPRTKWK